MTSTGPRAALIAEAVGVRQVVTTAELRDLIATLKFFWLDVFAGDAAVQTEVLTELGLDAADISWALRFGQLPQMAIGHNKRLTKLSYKPHFELPAIFCQILALYSLLT